ncbi:MAG: hypothetical protein R3Y35_07825 [Clostridia bacterium]
MSLPLLKLNIKKNIALISIILAVMLFYAMIIVNMYNPDDVDSLMAMYEVLPAEIISAFGFSVASASLTGFVASWLYGFILTVFPLVYSIIICSRLVSKIVDDGSIVCLVSTPNKRQTLIFTQIKFATISLFLIHLITFAFVLACSELTFSGLIEIKPFIMLNLTVTMLNICAMMICFFCSCLFSDNKKAVSVSSGITVGFVLLDMLGNVSEKTEFLKKFSIYGWFNPDEISAGANVCGLNFVYFGIIMVLGVLSIVVFKKKNLYI